MFTVDVKKTAEKYVRKADPKIRERFEELLVFLQTKPVPFPEYDVIKIAGTHAMYRVRLSGYRVQYAVDWNAKIIVVKDFDRRDEHIY